MWQRQSNEFGKCVVRTVCVSGCARCLTPYWSPWAADEQASASPKGAACPRVLKALDCSGLGLGPHFAIAAFQCFAHMGAALLERMVSGSSRDPLGGQLSSWGAALPVLCGAELQLWAGQSARQTPCICHSCFLQGLMQCDSVICIFVNYHMMNMGPYHGKPFLLTKCRAYSQFSPASVFVNFTLKDQQAQDARVHPSLSLSKEISAFLSLQVIWEGEEVHKLIYLELSAVLRLLTTEGVSSSSVVGWLWRRPHSSLKEHWAALESDFPTCSPLTNITITDSLFKVAWSSCQAQAALWNTPLQLLVASVPSMQNSFAV